MSGNTELMAAFDNLAKTVNQIQISNSISRAQGKGRCHSQRPENERV
jgi:hypothetical protein